MILETIAELARTRPFSDLSEVEKRVVLSEMPEAEYHILRRALTALPQLDAGIVPPADLRAGLLARFSRARRAPLYGIFHRAVPAWQAAAAVLAGIGFTFFFLKERPAVASQKIVYQTIIQQDTIYRTQTPWRERLVVRAEKPRAAGLSNTWNMENLDPEKTRAFSNTEPLAAPVPVGTPMSDRPELMDFFVSEKETKGK